MDRGQTSVQDAGDAMKQMNRAHHCLIDRFCTSLITALFLFVAAMPISVQAQTVTVQSEHLDIWEQKQEALFTGNVHLVRENFELFCDSLRAFYRSGKEGGGIDHALATGHVRITQGDKEGRADSAIIDNRKQLVTLRGNAVMVQEGGRVEGETIVHNLASKTTEVLQGGNGRVTLRIEDKKADVDGAQGETEPKDAEVLQTEAVADVPAEEAEKPPSISGEQEQQR